MSKTMLSCTSFDCSHLLSRLKLGSAGTHIAKDKDHIIVTNNRSKVEQAMGANEKLAKRTCRLMSHG